MDDLDILRVRVTLWIAAHAGPVGAHRRLLDALAVFHAGEQTRNAEEVVQRQALVAFMLAEDDTREEIARSVNRSMRTLERDIETLERVYGSIRAASDDPSGSSQTEDGAEPEAESEIPVGATARDGGGRSMSDDCG